MLDFYFQTTSQAKGKKDKTKFCNSEYSSRWAKRIENEVSSTVGDMTKKYSV